MMTRTKKPGLRKLFICILILLFMYPAFTATEAGKWIIGAEKFSYPKGHVQNAVSEASAEMLPVSILEKLSKSLARNILPDEKFQRENYKLKSERQSLYLQLSNQYKKRDTLMLNNYSEKELARKIKEENDEIAKIQDKIKENLAKVRELQEESEKNMQLVYSETSAGEKNNPSEIEKIKQFIRNIFVKDESLITQENIQLYQNDFSRLYTPSALASDGGYESSRFEKEVTGAGINTLITGTISGYGDYISVAVDLYLYPGAKKIGSVAEIGTMQDADIITTSIANQILPLITNAMPVLINFEVTPEDAADYVQIYIDEVLQTTNLETTILESGVHTIQFLSDGYKTAGTTYYFTGNTSYKIEVELKEKIDGFMDIELKKPIVGDFLVNGEYGETIDSSKTQIRINGNKILGQFIREDGETAFFYIPENLVFDTSVVKLNPRPYDREKNIDKRRRWMYASYSMLIVSLIPTFYTYGNLVNQAKLYKEGLVPYSEAIKYQQATNICEGISIGCGVFFAFELVRYILAANDVLPHKARPGDLEHFEYYVPTPEIIEEDSEEISEVINDNIEEVEE